MSEVCLPFVLLKPLVRGDRETQSKWQGHLYLSLAMWGLEILEYNLSAVKERMGEGIKS